MRFNYREALAGKSLLLLDFDGPVCNVFAGYPASQIAAELVETIDGFAPDLAAGLNGERDPMEALRSAAKSLPAELVDRVDEQLTHAELDAVESAEPTPGAAGLIVDASRSGITVAIVSNNGADAIAKYLNDHALAEHIHTVMGRPFGRSELMKPDPYLLRHVLDSTGIEAERACFVGDSVTDIEAGAAVGVATVGYANKPGKAERLHEAGATIVVDAF